MEAVSARGAEDALNGTAVGEYLSPEFEDGAAEKERPTECRGRAEPGIEEGGMLSEEERIKSAERGDEEMQMGELWGFAVETTGHHLRLWAAGFVRGTWRPEL